MVARKDSKPLFEPCELEQEKGRCTLSQWAKVKTKIQNPEVFIEACVANGLSFERVTGNDRINGMRIYGIVRTSPNERDRSHMAFLCEDKGGYRFVVDADPRYSAITQKLGPGGGRLMRDYTTSMVMNGVRRQGGSVIRREERADGSLFIRVGLAG